MRPTIFTPARLLAGIAFFTICCMLAISVVSERLADGYLTRNGAAPSIRVHYIHEVIAALSDVRESRRTYLSTGDPRYLTSYRVASARVDASLSRLLMQDQAISAKISHAADLEDVVHTKLLAIGDTLKGVPAQAAAAASRQAVTSAEDADLSRIEKLLDSLAQEQTLDQSDELSAARARSAFHYHLMIVLATINGLFLAGVALCVWQIKNLQKLITMCAWSRRVQYEGNWIPLEEYLVKRFGIRFSHGISQEEYDKWSIAGAEEEESPASVENPEATAPPAPEAVKIPRAAA